jgi:hypothetical protein
MRSCGVFMVEFHVSARQASTEPVREIARKGKRQLPLLTPLPEAVHKVKIPNIQTALGGPKGPDSVISTVKALSLNTLKSALLIQLLLQPKGIH